jgi:2'-5' RNA ligase
MIRSFIALELKDNDTIAKIQTFSSRLKQNQPKLKLVRPENLHMTVKFLGNIQVSQAPKIYTILKEEINIKILQGEKHKYLLRGVGQFKKFSVVWIKLIGDINLLQEIKTKVENILYERLKIALDKRQQFKPHLTIGRLRKERINYKNFDIFKRIINENKTTEFGEFTIDQITLKKSELTPKGPIYSDLVY